MRLGLWNRLAVVATALAVLIAPLWISFDIASDVSAARHQSYNNCMTIAQQRMELNLERGEPATYTTDMDQCNKEFLVPGYALNWKDWSEFLGGTLIVCAFIYALLWAFVATAKWVWRSRKFTA